MLGFLILGGLLTHFGITPYLNGDFQDEAYMVSSFLSGEEIDEEQLDKERFDKIERNIQHEVFNEFHREFGKDAFIKYEQFLRTKFNNPDDVYLFHYSKHELDNRSRQLNPNNDAYWRSRGYDGRTYGWDNDSSDVNIQYSKEELDNRSRQLNPNNDDYWKSRGYDVSSEDEGRNGNKN